MPVLPLVASMTVWPGFRAPERSASSMTARAMRSLTDPIGLNDSTFTNRLTPAGASFRIRTTGVFPIVSRMLSNLAICVAPFRGSLPRRLELSPLLPPCPFESPLERALELRLCR